MDIKLWHNKEMNLWRWTLIDRDLNMESGQQEDLKLAMVDIANTVEHLIEKNINNDALTDRNL
jgi:hypothetical protein